MKEIDLLTPIGPSVANFRGKVLLIVNVASHCGFTSQYKALQTLYDQYRHKGLEILGIPCNDFGRQEPGGTLEIQEFCQNQFGVTFSLFEKVKILGDNIHPLYQRLLAEGLPVQRAGGIRSLFFNLAKPFIYRLTGMSNPPKKGVEWNFHKFVIDKNAQPKAHFASDVEPDNPNLIYQIELELNKSE